MVASFLGAGSPAPKKPSSLEVRLLHYTALFSIVRADAIISKLTLSSALSLLRNCQGALKVR